MRVRIASLLLIFVAFAGAFLNASRLPTPSLFKTPSIAAEEKIAPHFETHFASSKLFTQVHAASAIELKDGRIRSYWFSGSREGAHDVEIHEATFDPSSASWSAEKTVITREQTQQYLHRYISKLGNPVIARTADGNLRLFFVTVSLGGWAGSSITSMYSTDEGATWNAPKRLVTSPFFNISTLIKGTPFLYQDGTLGLPVYHEFISKFGELLRLDSRGNVIDKQRLSAGGNGSLQPIVFIKNEQQAQVLMRYAGDEKPFHALTVSTQDAGQHWSATEKSSMRNSDSALTGVSLDNGQLLAVFNDLEHGRETLSLMISKDGGEHWQEIKRLEDQLAASQQADLAHYQQTITTLISETDARTAEKMADAVTSTQHTACSDNHCRYEFSYPYLIQTQRGDFHLVYTWNRTLIKHVSFNRAWLAQQP